MLASKRAIIEDIQQDWLRSVRSRSGKAARTFLNNVLGLMYIEPGQFILEFLQNAEDARMELGKKGGFFRIELWNDKVIIEHNGKPFDINDVENLCSTVSSKKPSKGYKGYIGIGWKSVFKVSSHVEVYSNGFAFAFNKEYWFKHTEKLEEFRLSPEEVLWQVTPIPIEKTEYIDPHITRFMIYLDDPSYYDAITHTVEELKPSVFLFLEYINKIEIIDHIKNKNRIIEWFIRNEETFNGTRVQEVTVNVYEDGYTKAEKFIVFKKEFSVPDEVRRDKITVNAQRHDVVKREVAIAFALDPATGDLKPLETSQFWGIYSFLPLHEVRSGLPFLIQADFIVHPGRRYINVEAKWNHWLMECIAKVLETAIEYLARRYPYSYLTVFNYRDIDDEVYIKLIRPTIVTTIEQQLKDPKVVCIEGHIINLSSAVKATDEVLELIRQGLIAEEDLAYIYGDRKHVLDHKVKLRSIDKAEILDITKLLNRDLIMAKLKEVPDKAIKILTEIYRLAYEQGINIPSDRKFIITSAGSLKLTSEVFLSELPPEVEELGKRFPEVAEYIKSLDFVHEKLTRALGVKILEWLGVRTISFKGICERILLPEIYIESPSPDINELVTITVIIKSSGALPNKPIWVVTRKNRIKESNAVYYPLQYFREIRAFDTVFEPLGIEFLDIGKYLNYDDDEEGWRRFFGAAGIKGLKTCEYIYPHYILHDDYKEIIYRVKKLLEKAPKDLNIQYTRVLKHLYDRALRSCWNEPIIIKVITDNNVLVDSSQCLLHDVYGSEERWAKWREEGFEIGPFISPEYIEKREITAPEEVFIWHEFLTKALGVRERASNEDIERFALWFTKHKLLSLGYTIEGHGGKGYDLIIRKGNEVIYVEVKGRRELKGDIELTESETQTAYEYRDRYWLIVVTDIPNDPEAYSIKDPATLQPKIVIPAKIIKEIGVRL